MSASSSDGAAPARDEAVILNKHAPALANYPHARRVGDLVFVSGCSSRRSDNSHAGVIRNADGTVTRDIIAQTRGCIENIQTVLRAAGGDLAHLVDLTTFLVNMDDYAGYNAVYDTHFDAATGPARTTVAVAQLPHPDLLIEIKAIAHIPRHD